MVMVMVMVVVMVMVMVMVMVIIIEQSSSCLPTAVCPSPQAAHFTRALNRANHL